MTMSPRLTTVLLSVALLGCGTFAYEWHSRLESLQSELEGLKSERERLRSQIAELETARKNAAEKAATAHEADAPEARRPGRAGFTASPDGGPPENWRGGGPGRFMAMMDNPEAQRLMAIQQKAGLDPRYASLFRALNLSPADLEKFKNLLVERQTTVMDAMTAARAQGLTGPENRDAIRQVVANAQAEVDNTIRSTLGDAAFAQYQTYEQTLPERNVVSQLQQRLSYSSAPLSDEQSNQIIALLAAAAPQPVPGSGPSNAAVAAALNPGGGPGPLRNGGGVPITDAVIAGSQGILNSTQIAALTQLQQEQQAQAQLRAQMRASSQQPATPTGTAPATAPDHH